MNLNFLGLRADICFSCTPMQSKYTNITIFMPQNDFVRSNVYDCYWTLFISSVVFLSTDHHLQDSKKNERTARSHSRKGPGTKFSWRTPPGKILNFCTTERCFEIIHGLLVSVIDNPKLSRFTALYS